MPNFIESLDLVELSKINDKILYDIRYQTTNNFTGKVLYDNNYQCLLRTKTAYKLNNVQADLEKQGFGLKIFDAYRPYSIQKLFWELVKDERYVVRWPKASVHNRGASVDLTLVTAKGLDIDMGTDFDDFSIKSSDSFYELSNDALFHRKLLKDVMIKNGFMPISTEWWHFNDSDFERYDVLNYDFTDFEH